MQDKPYIVEETPGPRAYCACDKSANMPYCDGAHKGTGISPTIVEVKEAGTVAICGCGKSENTPHCDGAHSKA